MYVFITVYKCSCVIYISVVVYVFITVYKYSIGHDVMDTNIFSFRNPHNLLYVFVYCICILI